MERLDRVERESLALKLVVVLAIVGAINWGLIGFFNWNLVDAIFGGGAREQTSTISRVIYAIVGVAGVALAVLWPTRGSVVTPGIRRGLGEV